MSALLLLTTVLPLTTDAKSEGEKMEKALNKVEKKLEKFEDKIESAWNVHAGERAVTMRANGDFRVSGVEVVSVNASSNILRVRFFGFERDINVAGARLIGGGRTITLADFLAGDKLTGSGNFNESTRAITVRDIHNLSYRNRGVNTTAIQNRINELLEAVRKLEEQLRQARGL
jgi:DNA-directed RNA polymerase subunit L